MKKILLSILTGTFFCLAGNAQVTFSPASFTAEDQVTLTVDVTNSSNTSIVGVTEAYIWIWPNSESAIKEVGEWTNSAAAAKMTYLGGNKWSYTFVPTTLFKKTAGELKTFGFLVKTKDGSKQSQDYNPFAFDPLAFTPSLLRIFPSKVGRDDVVSINFDKAIAVTTDEQRMTPTSAKVVMYDDAGVQVGTPLTLTLRQTASATWTASFIPTRSFTPPTGKKLKSFTYQFNGTVLNPAGGTTNVNTSTATVVFTEMK